LLFVVCASAIVRAESYHWPLNEPRKLSSSFGEYRDGHYHAGVDLRTFGRIGLPAIAPEACEATRLRVSPVGYGKALYVRLADGRTAVFAHLSGFSRALDSLAYYWRLERGTR
jgi:murein DD-endopeptidase MepM/ murein hydrolase activator NlpD